MGEIDPEFLRFGKAIMQRARNIEKNTDILVREAFQFIARAVIIHNPVWSGQSTLNWTAAVSHTLPPRRFVNIPRSNVKAREGGQVDILVDATVVATANVVAFAAVKVIAAQYQHPQKPSSALPRALDVQQALTVIRPPSLYLSNSISYAPKLWSGTWPSNPRTLKGELRAANAVLSNPKLLAR